MIIMSSKGFLLEQHKLVLAVLLVFIVAGIVVFSSLSPSGLVSGGQQKPDSKNPDFKVIGAPSTVKIGDSLTITADVMNKVAVSDVKIYVSDKLAKSCNAVPCIYSASTSTKGVYTFYATAKDLSGNLLRDPNRKTKDYKVIAPDKTPPVASISHVPASPLTGQTITLTATASDPLIDKYTETSGVKFMVLYIDPTLDASAAKSKSCKDVSCSYSTSYSTAGTHTYKVLVFDNANNNAYDPATGEKSFTVTKDTTPPTVSVSHSPLSPQVGDKVTLTATASDNAQLSKVEIYVDGSLKVTCTSSPCTYAAVYNLDSPEKIAMGSSGYYYSQNSSLHTYYAKAYDATGNIGTDSDYGSRSFKILDSTPPTVSVSHSPSKPKFGDTITITATASDNSGIAEIKINVKIGGTNDYIICSKSPCVYKKYNYRSSDGTGTPETNTYNAVVTDYGLNYASDPSTGRKSFTVS